MRDIVKGGQGEGYFKKTVKGISWMAFLRGLMRGLAIIKIAVLARFLLPSEFGIYGIAMIVFGLFEILTETGINIALIQEGDDIDDFISTAWIVSIIRGCVITLLLALIAPFIAYFFKTHEVLPLLRFASIIPFVRGFINPAVVKFQKRLAFHKEFYFRLCIYLVDTIGAVSVGILLRSAYALIWGMLIAALVEVFLSFIVAMPRPTFRFDIKKAQRVIHQGKWITFAGIFDYLFQHVDDIAIGKILGVAPLGLYQQAYRISTLSISEVGEIFNKVTFPSYVHIAHDKERLKKAFFKVTMVISFAVIPFGIVLFLFAPDIVRILLGEKWLGVVDTLKVLAIFGIFKALSSSAYSVLLAVKKQQIITLITLVSIIGLTVPLIPLIRTYGIVGASYAPIIGTVASLPFIIFYLKRIFSDKKRA